MYTSLAWVPRGVAQAKLDQPLAQNAPPEELEHMDDDPENRDSSGRDAAMDEDGISEEGGEENPLDIADVLANDLNSLTFYKSNKDDPLIGNTESGNGIYDPVELDELKIRPTDALLVAAKSGDEASHLEYHLLDDNPDDSDDDTTEYHPNTYVHHDMVLPAIPLCAAFSTMETDSGKHNLVAVGMFTPGIDIWDVDSVNALMPVQTLGGFDLEAGSKASRATGKKKKSSKKPRLPLKEDSHEEAILSLSWNKVQSEYLASGSADNTVKVWDVESAHCACTLSHHTDKVQSVAFHPSEESVLLTGSFDRSVHIVDVREQKSVGSWTVDADVESCHWLPTGNNENKVLVATELGTLFLFDKRVLPTNSTTASEPIVKWSAHTGAASALTVSPDIPGTFISGGIDKRVKMWSMTEAKAGSSKTVPKLLLDIPSKVGSVFSAALCPASSAAQPSAPEGNKFSPFVLAYGGQTGNVEVVDLGVDSKSLRAHYQDRISEASFIAMENRAARGSQAPRVLLKKSPQRGEGEDSDDCERPLQ